MAWGEEAKPPGSYPLTAKARRLAERGERNRIAEVHAQLKREFLERQERREAA